MRKRALAVGCRCTICLSLHLWSNASPWPLPSTPSIITIKIMDHHYECYPEKKYIYGRCKEGGSAGLNTAGISGYKNNTDYVRHIEGGARVEAACRGNRASGQMKPLKWRYLFEVYTLVHRQDSAEFYKQVMTRWLNWTRYDEGHRRLLNYIFKPENSEFRHDAHKLHSWWRHLYHTLMQVKHKLMQRMRMPPRFMPYRSPPKRWNYTFGYNQVFQSSPIINI